MTAAVMHAVAPVRGYWAALVEAWNRYRLFRETLGELQALSTDQLLDLGLYRDELEKVALEAVYGPKAR